MIIMNKIKKLESRKMESIRKIYESEKEKIKISQGGVKKWNR